MEIPIEVYILIKLYAEGDEDTADKIYNLSKTRVDEKLNEIGLKSIDELKKNALDIYIQKQREKIYELYDKNAGKVFNIFMKHFMRDRQMRLLAKQKKADKHEESTERPSRDTNQ